MHFIFTLTLLVISFCTNNFNIFVYILGLNELYLLVHAACLKG